MNDAIETNLGPSPSSCQHNGYCLEANLEALETGNSDTGKSHIALGLGLAACQKGLSVAFTTAAALSCTN